MTRKGALLERGICPVCGRLWALRLNGNLTAHRFKAGAPQMYGICTGSQQAPAPARNLRQRISDALHGAAFADWDAGEGTVIELPLDVAVTAVMTVLGTEGER